MTLQEYDRAVLHGEGDSQVLMIRVAKHKTGMTERASVSCFGVIMEQLRQFVSARSGSHPRERPCFFEVGRVGASGAPHQNGQSSWGEIEASPSHCPKAS